MPDDAAAARNHPAQSSMSKRRITGLRLFALRQLDDRQTHVRVTNLVFPYAFVIR